MSDLVNRLRMAGRLTGYAPWNEAAARIEALERACRLALGPLTGGMDGEWSEDAPDPVDVLRDVLSGATPPADGLRGYISDALWESMTDEGRRDLIERMKDCLSRVQTEAALTAHRGDKGADVQAIGAEVSP